MKTQLYDYLLWLYLILLWGIPLFITFKIKATNDSIFFIRKLLFPLQYLVQLLAERITSNSRSGTRLVHILGFLFAEGYLMILPFIPLYLVNEPPEHHMAVMFSIMYYMLLGWISFWFQPRGNDRYKTK